MVALVGLAGCAAADGGGPVAGGPVPIEAEEIRLSTSPCFGSCPVYAVTVRPDGTGTFEGNRFVAQAGTHDFAVDPADYRRFAERLRPYRPASGDLRVVPGEPRCKHAPTDMPGTEVRWSSNTGAAPQTLSFYAGCRQGNEALATALEEAPRLLPIDRFIGPRQRPGR